jgi:uncharacterized protein (DUF433 family)
MSKKKIALLVGAVLVVGVIALGGGAAYVFAKGAFASGDGPPIPFAGHGFFGGRGGRHGMWGFGDGEINGMDMFNAAAEAVGMTPEELFAELQAGKTPQEILEEHDVDWTILRETVQELMPEGGFGRHGGGRHGGGRRMGGFGGLGGDPMGMLDAAAKELGMTPEELFAEMRAGKTPQEIVEEQGLDPEEFFGDLGRSFIEQAVEDGDMSREQADWLLEGLEQGYVPMHRGEGGYWGPCGGEKAPSSSE